MFRQKSVYISVQKLRGDDVFALHRVRSPVELLTRAFVTQQISLPAHPQISRKTLERGAERDEGCEAKPFRYPPSAGMESDLLRGVFSSRCARTAPVSC